MADHVSTRAQDGSNSEDDSQCQVAIRCSSLGGKDFGLCIVSRDASVGQLMRKLMDVGGQDEKWFKNRVFTIGDRTFSFMKNPDYDPYVRFLETLEVQKALRELKPKQELYCCICECLPDDLPSK